MIRTIAKSWLATFLCSAAVLLATSFPCNCFAETERSQKSDTTQSNAPPENNQSVRSQMKDHSCCDEQQSSEQKKHTCCETCVISMACSVDRVEMALMNTASLAVPEVVLSARDLLPQQLSDHKKEEVAFFVWPPGVRVTSSSTLSSFLGRWLI